MLVPCSSPHTIFRVWCVLSLVFLFVLFGENDGTGAVGVFVVLVVLIVLMWLSAISCGLFVVICVACLYRMRNEREVNDGRGVMTRAGEAMGGWFLCSLFVSSRSRHICPGFVVCLYRVFL